MVGTSCWEKDLLWFSAKETALGDNYLKGEMRIKIWRGHGKEVNIIICLYLHEKESSKGI